jgi:hypothetical protein
MGGIGKKVIGSALFALCLLVAHTSVAVAAPIQIGTISWEDTPGFCSDEPCVTFTVTNDLHLLGAAELNELGLSGTESFTDVKLEGILDFDPIHIAPGTYGLLTTIYASSAATLFLDLSVGSFSFDLSGPLFLAPLEVTPVPEPASVSLVALGLGALYARGKKRRPTP